MSSKTVHFVISADEAGSPPLQSHSHISEDASERARSYNSSIRASSQPREETSQSPTWPWSCPYFDPCLTNADAIEFLLLHDTTYNSPTSKQIASLFFTDGKLEAFTPAQNETPVSVSQVLGHDRDLTPQLTAIFIPQKRQYFHERSKSWIGLSKPLWLNVLDRAEIPPSFLETLHTNNSACSRQVSYTPEGKPSVLHVSLKVGDWGNNEVAIYARQDLLSKRCFFLFLGTGIYVTPRSLEKQLRECKRETLTIFHVLVMFFGNIHMALDRSRWECDFLTQELESMTGHSYFGPRVAPLPLEEIRLTKKLQVYANSVQLFLWAAERYIEAIDFVVVQLWFAPIPSYQSAALKDAFHQKRSLISGLKTGAVGLLQRNEAQMQVTRSIVTERDSKINIQIATGAKEDSEIMRSIALVTMIFLPATFAATFFSMVFFNISEDGSRLKVEKHVWLYPVVTIPLTLVMAAWYLSQSSRDESGRLLAWWKSVSMEGAVRTFSTALRRSLRRQPHMDSDHEPTDSKGGDGIC